MPNMPVSFFKFKKFEDIKAMNFREDYLDVIGAVHEIVEPYWTASEFMEYCKNHTEEGPLILIIRRARLQKPTDRYPLQISNAWTGTKLIINEDIGDINHFKKFSETFKPPIIIRSGGGIYNYLYQLKSSLDDSAQTKVEGNNVLVPEFVPDTPISDKLTDEAIETIEHDFNVNDDNPNIPK
ncbi:hypothetical protein L195_g047079, partial [Trifolium pratense]